MTLSKSLYTRGIQCSKSLWLKKYSSEVLTPPDATALARYETGNIVGKSYRQIFLISHETEIKEMFEKVVEL